MTPIETFEKAKAEGCTFLDSFVFKYGSEMTAKDFYPILCNVVCGFLENLGLTHRTGYGRPNDLMPLVEYCDDKSILRVGFYGKTLHEATRGTDTLVLHRYDFSVSPDCLTLRLTEVGRDYKNAWFASDRYQFEEMFADFAERVRPVVKLMNRKDEVMTAIA